jgi:hypothetical protein
MIAPFMPLYVSMVYDQTLKMTVIDMGSEEVGRLRQASEMHADKLERGVVTGTYTVKGIKLK